MIQTSFLGGGGGGGGARNKKNRKCVSMFMGQVVLGTCLNRDIRCGHVVPGIRNPWRGIKDPRLS